MWVSWLNFFTHFSVFWSSCFRSTLRLGMLTMNMSWSLFIWSTASVRGRRILHSGDLCLITIQCCVPAGTKSSHKFIFSSALANIIFKVTVCWSPCSQSGIVPAMRVPNIFAVILLKMYNWKHVVKGQNKDDATCLGNFNPIRVLIFTLVESSNWLYYEMMWSLLVGRDGRPRQCMVHSGALRYGAKYLFEEDSCIFACCLAFTLSCNFVQFLPN